MTRIVEIVDKYIEYVTSDIQHHIQEEKYKFVALNHFQATFDINSDDLKSNIKEAFSKVFNLADGARYYPVASLIDIASTTPDEVRSALRNLFDQNIPEEERIRQFQETMTPLSQQYSINKTSAPYNMDLRFISLLLSLQFPDTFMYFKSTQVETVYTKIYGEKTGTRGNDPLRLLKARDLGKEILVELESRAEFPIIRDAMEVSSEHNLWFAQDVIWHEATRSTLLEAVKKFIEDNPDWRNDPHWQLTQEQIDTAVVSFKEKFSPQILQKLSDDDLLRWIPFRQESTSDGLSYLLEHSPIIGNMGGIRGGSAGKMGYYQGKDGVWKTNRDKPTTREDVLHHRRIDVEVLNNMYTHIAAGDYVKLKEYTNSLKINSVDDESRYKAVVPGLVWVRKYFTVLFPDKFLELYGNSFVDKFEKIAGIGEINGNGKNLDYSLWFKQMNKIAAIARIMDITNYALSRIVWDLIQEKDQKEDKIMEEAIQSSTPNISLNTIIYGPPGTGKTYSIRDYKDTLIASQSSKFTDLIKGNIKESLLYLFQKDNNNPANPFDIWRSEKFQMLQEYNGRTRSNGSAIRNELADNDVLFRRVEQDGRVLYQATDDGIDHIRSIVEAQNEQPHAAIDDFYEFITFHQSYGYEEFIEGIRAETNDSGSISYSVRDGVFKAFCRRAESDPDRNYLFVVDEINRGNISKIFGELITLIEPNKRLGASEAMTTTLPYSGDKFGVPKNVYIIGTMNTADRSIALLDIALRRRFDFKEIMPNPLLLSTNVDDINVQKLLSSINEKVVEKIDRDHQIGHSYLMETRTLSELRSSWYSRIVPLLQEYFYDDADELKSILKVFINKGETVQFDGDEFRGAIKGIYEETQSTDSGIQL